MYCQQCGHELSESFQNCPSCGSPTNDTINQPPTQSPQLPLHNGGPSPTYLVPSILVTLFCCQIFGIIAIVFSAIAMGKNSAGDFTGARDAAGKAKLWCWLGFGIGFVIIIIYAALAVMASMSGPSTIP
jgi:Interferon-induced transmembrane protein